MAQAARSIEIAEQTRPPTPLKLLPSADRFQSARKLYETIARRAFEIFESNGRPFGHDLDDWFKAESELLHPVRIDVSESDRELTVRAEVPGFSAQELEVSAEPLKITITGKRETAEERKEQKTVYTERSSAQLLRIINLPAGVETEKAEAMLKGGILELKMPKTAAPRKLDVAAK
jgi:HSP20 family protein